MTWLQAFSHLQVEIVDASVSDHALLRLKLIEIQRPPRRNFKFINGVIELPEFLAMV